jgi:3-oxoacyl-[acyl-carrier protein] reductase
MFDLKGVRSLITGAGGGIGRAISLRLAQAGCTVAVVDINADRVSETGELIREAGGVSHVIVADVSLQGDVDRMINETVSTFGGLDLLVNNAGIGSASFIEQVRDEDMAWVLNVNLIGVIRITRAAVPHLKKSKRGRIVNISSVEGIRGSGLLPVYGSSKAGLIGLTRSNAVELARFNITVNALCPGPIQTDMLAPLESDEKYREKMIRGIPMRRLGIPEDVAGAVVFFASEEASFITGNVLAIDGGMTVKAL